MVSWLIFTQPNEKEGDDASGCVEFLNASEFAARYLPGNSPGESIQPAPGAHQIFFGFSAEGLTAAPVPIPCFVASYAMPPERPDTVVPIRNWRQDEPTLYSCFGTLTFLPQKCSGLAGAFSLADLITAYLDGACSHYRYPQHRRGDPNLGVTLCKLECHLGPQVLNNAWVVFSYLDPSTLQLKLLPDQSLGWFRPKLDDDPLDPPESFRELQSSDQENDSSGAITYADTFVRTGRRHILPSEVGRSFLCFNKSEVVTYLLFWYLVRALASTRPAGHEFIKAFTTWRKAYDGDGDHKGRFTELLKTPVDLARDEFLQTRSGRRSASVVPRTFATMLEALDLGRLAQARCELSHRRHALDRRDVPQVRAVRQIPPLATHVRGTRLGTREGAPDTDRWSRSRRNSCTSVGVRSGHALARVPQSAAWRGRSARAGTRWPPVEAMRVSDPAHPEDEARSDRLQSLLYHPDLGGLSPRPEAPLIFAHVFSRLAP